MSIYSIASILIHPAAARGATSSTYTESSTVFVDSQVAAPQDTVNVILDPKTYVNDLVKTLNGLEKIRNGSTIKGVTSAVAFTAGASYLIAIMSGTIIVPPVGIGIAITATLACAIYGIGCGIKHEFAKTRQKLLIDNLVAQIKVMTPDQRTQVITELRKADPILESIVIEALQK